jgi:hypothetical protein
LKDFLAGKKGIPLPVDQGKIEMMDFVKFVVKVAEAEGRLVNAPTPESLRATRTQFQKITFAGGDDYVFALPCVDASKKCPVQQHELSIGEWAAAVDVDAADAGFMAASRSGPTFDVKYHVMRNAHMNWWEWNGVFNATMRMVRTGRIVHAAIMHVIDKKGAIDNSIYENVKEQMTWVCAVSTHSTRHPAWSSNHDGVLQATARPYLKAVQSVLWCPHEKRLKRELLKTCWALRPQVIYDEDDEDDEGTHVAWDGLECHGNDDSRWYLSGEPYDPESRVNIDRGLDGKLEADALAMDVEQALLLPNHCKWERAAEANAARVIKAINDSVKSSLMDHREGSARKKAAAARIINQVVSGRATLQAALKKGVQLPAVVSAVQRVGASPLLTHVHV